MENFIGIEQDEDDIIKNILDSKEFDFQSGFTHQENFEPQPRIQHNSNEFLGYLNVNPNVLFNIKKDLERESEANLLRKSTPVPLLTNEPPVPERDNNWVHARPINEFMLTSNTKKRGRKPKLGPNEHTEKFEEEVVPQKALAKIRSTENAQARFSKKSFEFSSYIFKMDMEDRERLNRIYSKVQIKVDLRTLLQPNDFFTMQKNEYTLIEDFLLIREIANAAYYKQKISKTFFKNLVENTFKKRSDSSLRLRYKFNLGALSKENLRDIMEFLEREQGLTKKAFLCFKTDERGNKVLERLETEDLSYVIECKRNTSGEENDVCNIEKPTRSEIVFRRLEKKKPTVVLRPKKSRVIRLGSRAQERLLKNLKESYKINNQTTKMPKRFNRKAISKRIQIFSRREYGSFKVGDRASEIIGSRYDQSKEEFLFLVKWLARPKGDYPRESLYNFKDLRRFSPWLLLDFLERKIRITRVPASAMKLELF